MPPSLKTFLKGSGLFLFFLGLGLAASYPLVFYLGQAIPYAIHHQEGAQLLPLVPGDHLQVYYWFWLFKDNLLGSSALFTNPYEFDVGFTRFTHAYAQFPLSLLFVPLSLFGNAAAHNLLILLSFPFAGLAMFAFLRWWVPSTGAALVGATVFVLAPFRQSQLFSGHINGYVSFLIPLILYLIERGYRRRGFGALVGAGVCLLSLALLDPHLIYYLSLFLVLFLPARFLGPLLLTDRPVWQDRPSRFGLPLIVGLLGAFGGYALRPQVREGPYFYAFLFLALWTGASLIWATATDRTLKESRRLWALVLSPTVLLGFYQWSLRQPQPFLRRLPLILAFLLAGILAAQQIFSRKPTFFLIPRLKNLPWRRILPVLILIALFMGLAGGYSVISKKVLVQESIVGQGRSWSELTLFSARLDEFLQRINFRTEGYIYPGLLPLLSGFLLLGLLIFSPAVLPLRSQLLVLFFGAILFFSYVISFGPFLDPLFPVYKLLFNHLPFFNYPRSPGRVLVIGFLALGTLTAIFSDWLMQRFNKNGRILPALAALVMLALILWDFHPQGKIGLSLLDEKNPFYAYLHHRRAVEKKHTRVLGLPLFPGDSHQSSLYEYYITLSRVPMVNGYSPVVSRKYVDQVFWPLLSLNVGELDERQYGLLRKMGVTHVMHHQELYFYKVSPFSGHVALKNLQASPYLRLLKTDGTQSLFEVRPPETVSPVPATLAADDSGIVYELEDANRFGRTLVPDEQASQKKALAARAGQDRPGRLAATFFRYFPSGSYRADFRMKSDGAVGPRDLLLLQVLLKDGKTVVAEKTVRGDDFSRPGAYERFPLAFTLQRPQFIGFQVAWFGGGDVALDKLVVRSAVPLTLPRTYEAEELFRYLLTPRPDPSASGGRALRSDPGIGGPTYVLFGPHRTLDPGNYRAVFRLKTEEKKDDRPVLDLDIATEGGTRILNRMEIKENHFAGANQYAEFALPFRLHDTDEVEFRVFSRQRIPFWVDWVRVEKAGQ